ncbi:MAG TPA: cytochrome c, partial [Caulobacteraceae bacterium]
MRRNLINGAAATVVAALALATVSEAVAARKPTKQQLAVIEHRQAQMKQLGGAMKTLAGFARGQGSSVTEARSAAALLSRAGATMPHLWPAGTQVGVGDSSTRASLWKERDAFAQRVAQF